MEKLIEKINKDSSQKEVLDHIFSIREKKGQERLALALINTALKEGHSFVVELFFEEALVYQHLAMSEFAKSESKQNKVIEKESLLKMEESIKMAEFYINKFRLNEWKSRLYRFWGRIYDYKNNYKKSIQFYKRALKLSKKDPEFLNYGVPRFLEIEAFLASAYIMVGKTNKGYRLAKDLYKIFDNSEEGKNLKKKDYYTWAIWRTGIPIRTINAFYKTGVNFEKNDARKWLEEAGFILNSDRKIKIGGDVSFQFRKEELNSLMKKIERSN